MIKNNSERLKKHYKKQAELGRIRRSYFATLEEHEFIKELLKTLRDNEKWI